MRFKDILNESTYDYSKYPLDRDDNGKEFIKVRIEDPETCKIILKKKNIECTGGKVISDYDDAEDYDDMMKIYKPNNAKNSKEDWRIAVLKIIGKYMYHK